MRQFLLIASLALAVTAAAAQATWQEYTYPGQQFAISFPAAPSVTTAQVKDADGSMLTQTVYSVRQPTATFRVAVTDFGSAKPDGMATLDRAAAALRQSGDVKLDIEARVQGNYGRYLNIAGRDGSHMIAAVFFGGGRLYQVEGAVPAGNADALSGEMILFEQSLRFMGSASSGP